MKLLKNTSFIFLTLFVSLFFFISSVYADTLDVTLSEDPLTYITTDFFTIKDYSDNYITSQNNYKYYFISYENGVYKSTFIYNNSSTNSLTLSYSNKNLNYTYDKSTTFKRVKLQDGSIITDIESTGIPYSGYWCNKVTNCHYTLLDTNIPTLTTNNNTINLVYEDNTYSFINTFKTVYQLYLDIHPTDDYPILTSFYSTFIDRLTYILDYISTSYVFLSVFVIFIFIFVLQLFRRLL